MYDFTVDDCLYHPTCKNVFIGFLENIEIQKMFASQIRSPEN